MRSQDKGENLCCRKAVATDTVAKDEILVSAYDLLTQIHYLQRIPVVGIIVHRLQNIDWDFGGVLRPGRPQVALDKKPEFALKSQISFGVGVFDSWMDQRRSQNIILLGTNQG